MSERDFYGGRYWSIGGRVLPLQAIGNRWRMVASRERRLRFGGECLSLPLTNDRWCVRLIRTLT